MPIDPDLLLVLTSSELGQGPSDLGEKLTDLHLGVLAGSDLRPAVILFLNSAIFLTTEGSPVLAHLEKLEAGGTRLVSCITCLTYHDRLDRLLVGERGDMKGTVAAFQEFSRVITL